MTAAPAQARLRRRITPYLLARALDVDVRTVLDWIGGGGAKRSGMPPLPALNVGAGEVPRYRLYWPDVKAWLEARGSGKREIEDAERALGLNKI